ncbi:MAG: hypothetical protein HYV28_13425 [Ignavibacteriales bacterium]|nr:hypothetical protein [Ignavibacteriales bacterium]
MQCQFQAGGGTIGQTVLHEIFEAYVGAIIAPGPWSDNNYNASDKASMDILP